MPEQLVIECAHEKSPNRFRCCIWLSARHAGRSPETYMFVHVFRVYVNVTDRHAARIRRRELRERRTRGGEQKAKHTSESD